MKKFVVGDSVKFKDGRLGVVEDYSEKGYLVKDNYGAQYDVQDDDIENDKDWYVIRLDHIKYRSVDNVDFFATALFDDLVDKGYECKWAPGGLYTTCPPEKFDELTADVNVVSGPKTLREFYLEDGAEIKKVTWSVNDESKKMTFSEISELFRKHNQENGIASQYEDKNPLYAVIVFSNSSFDKEYPIESRSYKFRSDEKRFIPNMLGGSIFGHSLDDTDHIRIDWYLPEWDVEYCYLIEG